MKVVVLALVAFSSATFAFNSPLGVRWARVATLKSSPSELSDFEILQLSDAEISAFELWDRVEALEKSKASCSTVNKAYTERTKAKVSSRWGDEEVSRMASEHFSPSTPRTTPPKTHEIKFSSDEEVDESPGQDLDRLLELTDAEITAMELWDELAKFENYKKARSCAGNVEDAREIDWTF